MSSTPSSANREDILKRSLLELRELRTRLKDAEKARNEPIAIVGIGCRFPGGSNSADEYWQMLYQGIDATREIPHDRWNVDEFYDADPNIPGKMYVRRGGFLDTVDQFDPFFFNIPPREARTMDPQHRLFLEVAWEAVENAGYAPDHLKNSSTGVFLGITSYDYAQLILQSTDTRAIDAYMSTGNPLNFAAGRISYILGLQGPSIAMDTACSSSLVAIHLACQSLRTGESNMALAGGVNLVLMPETMITLSKARMLASDGRCKTFDARADGYGRGEGAGAVVLKRLSDAIADGDQIWAVIRGSAVNQDGPSSGLTVPNGQAQQQLIHTALSNAQIEANQIAYIEAHGTGTSLGDPIELRALEATLGEGRSSSNPLMVGSVKTNMGHLEAASGIAGFIKVVLSLYHKQIPPHLHFDNPNPNVDWEKLNVKIPTQLEKFPDYAEKAFAGVSSFGVSGTNAHIILEAPPEQPKTKPENTRPAHIMVLSAPQSDSLPNLAQAYSDYLKNNTDELINVTHTANTGRAQFSSRTVVVAESSEQMQSQLAEFAINGEADNVIERDLPIGQHPKVAFLFTGQGSQYSDMGRQLYDTQPLFKQTLDTCSNFLKSKLDVSLVDVMFKPEHSDLLDQTLYTQPALFAIEYALAQLWMSWGIKPAAVMGHSVGEYVAACIAGVFSLEDALTLISARGRLMQLLPTNGSMVAIFADAERIQDALEPYKQTVAMAALNSPKLTVISGLATDVALIVEALSAQGIRSRDLRVSHAFHSPLMQPMLAEFGKIASGIDYQTPTVPLISNFTGSYIKDAKFEADYWIEHIISPVHFAAGMQTLYQLGYRVYLEIGPKPTLIGMGRQSITDAETVWLPSLDPSRHSAWFSMLLTLGNLFTQGAPVDWQALDEPYQPERVRLPNTPYMRQRFWISEPDAPKKSVKSTSYAADSHPLIGQRVQSPLTQYETEVNFNTTSLISQHRIYGMPIMPGIIWIEMGMLAQGKVDTAESFSLENYTVWQPMIFGNDEQYTVQVLLTQDTENFASVEIYSLDENGADWHLNSSMDLRVNGIEPSSDERYSAEEIQARATDDYTAADFYANVWHPDFHLGDSFRCIEHIWRREGEALARIHFPADITGSHVRPELLLLDACVQLIVATLPKGDTNVGDVYVGLGQEYTHIYRQFSGEPVWCQAVLHSQTNQTGTITGSLYIFDDAGELVGEFGNVSYRRSRREGLVHSAQSTNKRRSSKQSGMSRAVIEAKSPIERVQLVENYLREIIAQVVGLESTRIDSGRSLLDMVDSLMSIEIKNQLEMDLEIDVPLSDLLSGAKIDEIAELLTARHFSESQSANGHSVDEGMDVAKMETLATLPDDIQIPQSIELPSSFESVFLTGGTGFVGAFLIAELVAQSTATVYCLVRASSQDDAMQRLKANLEQYDLWNPAMLDRVVAIAGDLGKVHFGLNDADYDQLSNGIDLIWHCGAAVKWTYPYQALASVNVDGTREIIELASSGRVKPLHYVSTVGVFSSREFDGVTVLEDESLSNSGTLFTGYAQTKWVAEKLVQVAAERGLPVNIYRINTSGHSETGVSNAFDYLTLLLRGCIEMGSAPEDLELTIQGAPIDFAGKAMVYLSLNPDYLNQTYHIVNPEGMSWQQMLTHLRDYGYPLQSMDYQSWSESVQIRSQQDRQFALAGLSALFAETFPEETRLPLFDCQNVKLALRDSDIICPPFNEQLFQRYLHSFYQSDFLTKP